MRVKSWIVPYGFLLLAGFLLSRICYGADYVVTHSSNATGSSSAVTLPTVTPGDYLGSVFINSRSAGAETLKIYDSSGSASGLIGTIDLSTGTAPSGGANTANQYQYNLRISSGITVSKSAAGSDVTITWKHVR